MEQLVIQYIRPFLAVAFVIGVAGGCGEKKDSTKTEATSALGELPDVPVAAGQLIFTVDTDVDTSSIAGYVVGKRDLLKVERALTGELFINNVPAGQHDVLIIATSTSASLVSTFLKDSKKAPDVGIRLSNVEALNGVRTKKEHVELPALVSVSGASKLSGQSDHAGIDIYIPGTEYIAKSASDGSFSFSGVPVGTHNFYFEKDGYLRGQFEGIEIQKGDAKTLDAMTLLLDTGTEGFMILNGGNTQTSNPSVLVSIGAGDSAKLMKVSEDASLKGAAWKPLKTSFSYTFESDGNKTLYAKIANANGLESSVFSSEIRIDQAGPSLADTSVFLSTGYVAAGVNATLNVNDLTGGAAQFRYGLTKSELDSASWQPFVTNFLFPYASKLFLQFRDTLGNTSVAITKDITYSASSSDSRRNPTRAIIGTKILFAGGDRNVNPQPCGTERRGSNVMDIFDVLQNSWSTVTMPATWNNSQSVVVGSKALFYGKSLSESWCGGDSTSYGGDIYLFNSANKTWKTFSIPAGYTFSGAEKAGSKAVLYGTYNVNNQSYPSIAYIVDFELESISNVSLSEGRNGQAVLVSEPDSKIALVGGYRNQEKSSAYEIINLNTGTLSASGTLASSSGQYLGKAVIDGRHFVALQTNCTLLEWQVSQDQFVVKPGGEGKCYSLERVGSKILFYNENSTALFNPATDTWTTRDIGYSALTRVFGDSVFSFGAYSEVNKTTPYAIFHGRTNQWLTGTFSGWIIGDMLPSFTFAQDKLYFITSIFSGISNFDLVTGAFNVIPAPASIIAEQQIENSRIYSLLPSTDYTSDGSSNFFSGRIWFFGKFNYSMRSFDIVKNTWNTWIGGAQQVISIGGKHFSIDSNTAQIIRRIDPDANYIGSDL